MIKLNPVQPTDKLKEMYGQNLIETLWPYVLNNEIEAFSPDNNRKLRPEELNASLSYNQQMQVPIWDSTSAIPVFKYIIAGEPINTKRFTDVQLIQDWYYHRKKNMVFSSIRELFVYTKEGDKELVPVLKLVFK